MSEEMKKLVIDGQEFEVVDAAGRQRITVLENSGGSGGSGLSITEKNLILQLFGKALYDEDISATYNALSALWSGTSYSVVWEGTGYTKSNDASVITDGGSFTSTITANEGKTIESVTVLMGGETVVGAYSSGTITIPNVTGNIVITVTTAQMTVSSISAVYTQSGTVYDTDSLDSLKSDLVVTATFPDSSTAVIPATDYTLSGTLLEGTSTITVSYGGKTASFNVTVTHLSNEYEYEIVGTGVVDASGGVQNNSNYYYTSFFDLDDNYSALTLQFDSTNDTIYGYVQVFNGDTFVSRISASKTTTTTKQFNYSSAGTVTKARLSYSPKTLTNVKIMKGLV